MPARKQVDGERDQAQRSGERGRGQGFETEHRMGRRLDHGRGGSRFGRVNQHRDNGLKQAQRFVCAGRSRRGLRIGIRGKRSQAGENEASKSHHFHFSTTQTASSRADCG